MTITPYLCFNGQAEQAVEFYADMLGGKVDCLHRYSQWPASPDAPSVPENYMDKIMHSRIDFSGTSISVADTLPTDPRDFGNGGQILTLVCDSIEQTESVWKKLTVDARTIGCELQEVFYAERYGEAVDKFGVHWAIMFDEK